MSFSCPTIRPLMGPATTVAQYVRMAAAMRSVRVVFGAPALRCGEDFRRDIELRLRADERVAVPET